MRPKLTPTLPIPLAAAILAAAPLLLTPGCHRGVVRTDEGLQTGRVSERRLANLRRLASRDTGCDAAMLEPHELGRGIYEVVGLGGCQVVRHYVMACGHRYRCRWQAVAPIEQQAMSDLGCAPDSIWVRATGDPMVRTVFACGVSAPYRLSCWARGCAWAMAGQPQQATPPADATQVGTAAPAGEAQEAAEGDGEAGAGVEVEVGAAVDAEESEAPESEAPEPETDPAAPPPPWAE